MRFLIKALLAATALVPTAAVAQEREGRQGGGERRAERQAARQAQTPREDRPQRVRVERDTPRRGAERQAVPAATVEGAGRPDREAERAAVNGEMRQDRSAARQRRFAADADAQQRRDRGAVQPSPGADLSDRNVALRSARRADGGARGDDRRVFDVRRGLQEGRNDRFDARNDGRNNRRGEARNDGWNRGDRGNGNVRNDDRNGRTVWNRGWRNDQRYDYGGYRNANRSAYRLPRYYAPYGWGYGYRRFSVGITLNAILFDENYWIDDPYEYRLPEAYEPYRWVRYYNDALLVDVRYGRVVDVVYDIFW